MKSVQLGAALAASAVIAGATLVASGPATAAEAPTVVINEIESSGTGDVLGGADWVELINTGDTTADVSGLVFKDDDDAHAFAIPDGTSIPAGGFLVLTEYDDVDHPEGDFDFGLGGSDTARLFADDGTTLLDTFTQAGHAEATYGRCPDGTGGFVDTASATPGAANDCPTPATPETAFRINEAQSTGETADFIEVVNTASVPVDFDGVVVMDGKDEDAWVATGIGMVPAGGYVHLISDVHFTFGLGKGDSARLFAPGTALTDIGGLATATDPFDATSWPADQHTAPTWGRCPDATGDFRMTAAATPGDTNDCDGTSPEVPDEEPAELSTGLAINEVESNGDDTDWFEVANLTDAPIDISGYAVKDNDSTRTDVVPAGSVVPANGLLVIDQESATHPEGFTFGLGNGDAARLYDLEGSLVAKHTWSAHALVTWARCPDGTGDWRDATTSTKGEPNDCSAPVRINEVESSGTDAMLGGADFIELTNVSAEPLDLTGFTVKDDNDDHAYTFPPGAVLDAGAFVVVTDDELGAGIGGTDTARVFDADGVLVDSFTQPGHAGVTWGRCPDGTGDFEDTAEATPGKANICAGLVYASAWPGGSEVTVLDEEGWFSGDLSGIDYASSGTDESGTLWAVQNGDGLLYKLEADATGAWEPSTGWETGRTLRFPDGTGTVDAEGVTVVAGEPGVVYVSVERDNDEGGISRPSVLRYETAGSGGLTATHEWNLAADFAGLGANQGVEGVTWIPDAVLVTGGFIDASTDAVYDPADYPGHGGGAFAIGVEGTQEAYLYALESDGDFTRLATLDTTPVSFDLVADVQWDAERGVLWVACDEACGGRIATYGLVDGAFVATALYERPAGMANIANEGFAIADAAMCVDGAVPTFYVDDNDTDGFSLRSGTLDMDCADAGDGDGNGPGDGDSVEEGDGDQARKCAVSAPASAAAGARVTLRVDPDCTGAMVRVVMYSEPTVLGTFAVTADGTVAIRIPADLAVGAHTIEVQLMDGTVIGSTGITVAAAVGELSQTGASEWDTLALVAALLATLGGALVVARRTAA
ncbi:lamin tail domain-containing protein [Demequina aestuarii]|uniref:lamin tail domain-containing protein n=1 Tax=Demequina aestuarii TaxID=327095 RepID=UPI0007854285|nr:lamin tail domain-containing protein [Demequina aestuarii]